MDWQKLINQFQPINSEDLKPFAVTREVGQAVATYNRALTNLKSQNGDIALIALRKLAATYPEFGEAMLLYGLSLALYKQPDEARSLIAQAVNSGLSDTYMTQAEKSLTQLDLLIEQRRQAQTANGARPHAERAATAAAPGSSPVLEKTGHRGKVRMASDKERQDVIRRGEFATEEETNVKVGREPIEYLRIAIPALAIVIVAGLLIFFGIRLVSNLTEANRLQRANADRLTWLVDRLENMASGNPAIASLLDDYEAAFTTATVTETVAPTVSPTTATPTETTPSETSAGETTTAATEPTTSATFATTSAISIAAQTLAEADAMYKQAVSLAGSDLRGAGDLLLSARSLLADIPGTTTAPQVSGDAAALSSSVESLINDIGPDAAEANRLLGLEKFHIPDYQAALQYFLAGYQLYPRAYGGGVAYYCGRCYQELGDKTAAKPYYDFVIKYYSDRPIGDSARARLSEMGY